MEFVKMEGLGNDFVVVDDPGKLSESTVQAWCDRRLGVGADGVLGVSPADPGSGAEIRMQYWNADGSAAEMCGNGLRCVARYAFDRSMVTDNAFVVATATGLKQVEVQDQGMVRVQLGSFALGEPIEIEGRVYHRASVGNPHAVTFVDEISHELVNDLGPLIETHERFSAGVNVEFVKVQATTLSMRVWERGVGETLACGTGAAAVAAVANALGEANDSVTVELLGGNLDVELVDDQAWITGPASYVFTGVLAD
ncbi:MAG TPA: diaminopimelate epimerase [Actinobacteria bacterium]|nr:diaminopimelate epimerase [Actinomycetota bacterium]